MTQKFEPHVGSSSGATTGEEPGLDDLEGLGDESVGLVLIASDMRVC